MLSNSFEISVVIATRNRQKSLQRTLDSLIQQIHPPIEIIIVDASDSKPFIKNPDSKIPINWTYTHPSVCAQRNKGIRKARAEWVFICDDDIELEPNHFAELASYCKKNPSCGAVAGLLLQKEREHWVKNYPITTTRHLIWSFIFQLSIWGDIQVNSSSLLQPIIKRIKRFYQNRGNSQSLGGWPLITDWREPVFESKFYSLGAALVKKEWLLNSPFDETLDAYGIGDNYGVALGFPQPIHILSATHALHHRAEENRLAETIARTKRILALNYFQKANGASVKTRLFLLWSVVSFLVYGLFRDRANFTLYVKTFLNCLKGVGPGI